MQIWLDEALSLMRSVPHARVVEIGCGVGLVAAALAPGGRSYFGLDLSSEGDRLARRLGWRPGRSCRMCGSRNARRTTSTGSASWCRAAATSR